MWKHDIPMVVRTTQDKINNYLFVRLSLKMTWRKPKCPILLYVTTKYT